jgi:Mor family transcriptional regulator
MKHLSGHTEDRRHALYEGMVSYVTQNLLEYGLGGAAAEAVANAIADHLADYWSGQTITFPKEYQRRLSKRDVEIYERYNGPNRAELARELGISERSLYKLIARVRRRLKDQAANRPQLFEMI